MAFNRKPPPGNVRRVRSMGTNARGVTTNKRGRLVQFESEQEHTLILLFERDATILDYASQPETFPVVTSTGRHTQYTPDFQVWRSDGCIELHEVTITARRLAAGTPPAREVAALGVCQQRGWRYLVHTEQTLPRGAEYANLTCLAAFRSACYADPSLAAWWQAQLAGQPPMHPADVLAQAAPNHNRGWLVSTLAHLLWHGTVQMDWHQTLLLHGDFSASARIWLPVQAGGAA